MYDVTGVNVFPRKLMKFPRKEKVNSVPYPLLLTFKGDQGGSFQFRLFSVIIVASVKVRAFLDFYAINISIELIWKFE